MWRRKTYFARRLLVAVDTVVSAAAFLATLALRYRIPALHSFDGPRASRWFGAVAPANAVGAGLADYLWLLVGMVPLWALAFAYSRTGEFRVGLGRMLGRYLQAVLLGVGLFILAIFLFKITFIARSFVVQLAVVQFVSLVLARVTFVQISGVLRRRDSGDGHRVLIVGTGREAVEFARLIEAKSAIRIKMVGYAGVPGEAVVEEARPLVGHADELADILDRLPVDEVVFAVPGKQAHVFKDAIAACDERGVDVILSLPPQLPSAAKLEIANVTGFNMPMLGLRRTPTGELRLAAKRLLDFFAGLTLLILAAPVMLATAIAIKLDSKGPVLFKQVRAGRNGRKFTMYKFRSMVVDAETKKADLMHLNEMGGPVFKLKRDPRITRVGRVIRKTSIDELPQVFNILAGDMSLVGPRPPLPSEVEGYEPWQRRRLSVKPGLTGLWQVSGRNQVDFDEWMQLDLQYIDNWSLWLDIKIILKTIPAVLFQKGSR